MKTIAKMEDLAAYTVTHAPATKNSDDSIIAHALAILHNRMKAPGHAFCAPQEVKDYCCLNIGILDHEVFGVLFLDSQNRLIEYRAMFRGTLTQTSVYPREVAKEAMMLNAASVVLTHNHPSGSLNPSRADESLTQTLKTTLALIDVRVLDHVIVSGDQALSMAEKGLL